MWLCTRLKSDSPVRGTRITRFTMFSTLVVPVSLIIIDMSSDVGVLGSMWSPLLIHRDFLWTTNMTSPENATVQVGDFPESRGHSFVRIFNFLILFVLLMASLLSFLRPNPLPSLLKNTRTKLFMSSREHERNDIHVPLGKLKLA